MITFLYGGAGTGKSTRVAQSILNDLKENRRVLLLVPEQETVSAENRISLLTEKEGGIPTVDLEILNFRRLANRFFREYGSLSYHYIGKGARNLIMWQAISSVSDRLTEYRTGKNEAIRLIPLMLKAYDDFAAYRVTPSALEEAAKAVRKEKPKLAARLTDLSLVTAVYSDLLHRQYDDPKDDPDRLCSLLDEHPEALEPYTVYIDSFHGFTPQEFAVIRRIFAHAEHVTVTLGYQPGDDSPVWDAISDTSRVLARMAADVGKETRREVLKEAFRFRYGDLSYLSRRLWEFGKTGEEAPAPEHVRLLSCADRYSEAETAAQTIASLLRGGARCREIAIIVRSTERYTGILDAYLDKYGIPYFLSVREPLVARPLIRLILTALRIRADGWKTDDVIAYLKTGLTGIPQEAADEFETYVNRWSIHGKRFYDDRDFTMNPDGFVNVLTEKSAYLLDRINETRRSLIAPLTAFFEAFDGDSTVWSVSAALYRFLRSLHLPERLKGDDDIRLFNAVSDALDTLVAVLNLSRVTADVYAKLFSLLIREADLGHIPRSGDCVTVGSSATVRADGIRYAFLLGAAEGEFPAEIGEDPLFSDTDKLYLENICGLSLTPRTDRLRSEELYGFLRAVSTASDGLYISWPKAGTDGTAIRPSGAVLRIKKLFHGFSAVSDADLPVMDRIVSPDASFETAIRFGGTPEGRALKQVLAEREEFLARLDAMQLPITDPDAAVAPDTVDTLFSDEMDLTQSKIESFVGCPFSYWCKYHLNPDGSGRYTFEASDSGTFVHYVLETFFREIRTENGTMQGISDETIREKLDRITDDYFRTVTGTDEKPRSDEKFMQIFRRLRRSSYRIVRDIAEEFRDSSFLPDFFELKIGKPTAKDPDAVPSPVLLTKDGKKVTVSGKIDRVDSMREEDTAYVRIVDYKTGQKQFDEEELAFGRGIQMPLYLFSLCDSDDPGMKKRFGLDENGVLRPAGFLYYHAATARPGTRSPLNAFDAEEERRKGFKRDGLLTCDPRVLRGMEPELKGRFIPVTTLKDGSFSKNSKVVGSEEEFDTLKETVRNAVTGTAETIFGGTAAARPDKDKKHDPCKYCDMRPICRHIDRNTEEEDNDNA